MSPPHDTRHNNYNNIKLLHYEKTITIYLNDDAADDFMGKQNSKN